MLTFTLSAVKLRLILTNRAARIYMKLIKCFKILTFVNVIKFHFIINKLLSRFS